MASTSNIETKNKYGRCNDCVTTNDTKFDTLIWLFYEGNDHQDLNLNYNKNINFEFKKRDKFLEKNTLREIHDEKFLYFPLQSEPEAAILNDVVVNDENQDIKNNRLELLKMFCNTFDNFIDFSKLEGQ